MSLELYTKRLNEIVRPSGDVKEQLLSAIKDIEAKIEYLKEIIFLSENCEISHFCHASEDLKVRMEKLFEGVSKNQEQMMGLLPKVSPLHDVAYPVIQECEALTKQLRILEFAEHLSFLE